MRSAAPPIQPPLRQQALICDLISNACEHRRPHPPRSHRALKARSHEAQPTPGGCRRAVAPSSQDPGTNLGEDQASQRPSALSTSGSHSPRVRVRKCAHRFMTRPAPPRRSAREVPGGVGYHSCRDGERVKGLARQFVIGGQGARDHQRRHWPARADLQLLEHTLENTTPSRSDCHRRILPLACAGQETLRIGEKR